MECLYVIGVARRLFHLKSPYSYYKLTMWKVTRLPNLSEKAAQPMRPPRLPNASTCKSTKQDSHSRYLHYHYTNAAYVMYSSLEIDCTAQEKEGGIVEIGTFTLPV